MSNALKFTQKGSVKIIVEIRRSSPNNLETQEKGSDFFLYVEVVDTGIGIKDEDKEKLFKPFGYL